jgi:hypothetical protein
MTTQKGLENLVRKSLLLDGLIRETELFFDARPFEAMQKAQADRSVSK